MKIDIRSDKFYCFSTDDSISIETRVLLYRLLRNLGNPKTKAKTENHPIAKQFTEVLDLIHSGEK